MKLFNEETEEFSPDKWDEKTRFFIKEMRDKEPVKYKKYINQIIKAELTRHRKMSHIVELRKKRPKQYKEYIKQFSEGVLNNIEHFLDNGPSKKQTYL